MSAGQGVFFQKITGNALVPITPPQNGTTLKIGTFDKVELAPIRSGDMTFDNVKFNPTVLPFLSKGDNGQTSGGFLDALKDKIGQVVWIEEQTSTPVLKGDTLEISISGLAPGRWSQNDLAPGRSDQTQNFGYEHHGWRHPDHLRQDCGPASAGCNGAEMDPQHQPPTWRCSNCPLPTATRGWRSPTARPRDRLPRHLLRRPRPRVQGPNLRRVAFRARYARHRLARAVVLNGVGTAFQFTGGELQIAGSRFAAARLAGSGRLPPELVGDAKANIVITLQAAPDGRVEIASANAELDKSGDPIVCEGTRFHFTITKLGFSFVRDGGYHFYFLLTGSAEFRPNAGEYGDGLLQYLKSIRIDLDQAPLAGDLRVLMRHISIQVPISPRKKFPLFNLFEFELRGIGFYPASDQFDGDPH